MRVYSANTYKSGSAAAIGKRALGAMRKKVDCLLLAVLALSLSGCQTAAQMPNAHFDSISGSTSGSNSTSGGTLGSAKETPQPQPVEANKQQAEQTATATPPLEDKKAGRIFQHYLSGVLAESRGQMAKAGQHYMRAMRADENNTYLQNKAFSLLLASGNYLDATQVAKAIISGQPEDVQPLVQMLLIFDDAITGNTEKARKRLAEMRRNAPNLIQFELIDLYIRLAQGADPQALVEELKSFQVGAGMLVYKYYHLGRLHRHAGQPQEAMNAFHSGKMVDPGSLFVVSALADMYIATGAHQKAEQALEGFLNLNPKSLLVYMVMKNAAQEKPLTLEKPSISSDLSEVMYGLASLMVGKEVDIAARQFLHLALMAKSDNHLARFMLGLVEEKAHNYAQAKQSYEKIPKATAPYLAAQVRIGQVLHKTDTAQKAIGHIKKLTETYPDVPRLHQPLAQLYHDQKNYQQAAQQYTVVIEEIAQPARRHAALYFARGAVYERLGKYQKAAQDMETSLELEPNNPVVLNYLGYMWLDQGRNLDDAYGYIRQAAHLRPHDAAIVDSLGWVYYKKGKYDTAIRHLEKAVSLLPNDPVINMHLGDAYHKMGRREEAKTKWQRALNLNPESPNHVERLRELLAE